eukprot:scaffold407932_cov46-Prasinocladus_malaysianus.AAC.2
MVTEPLGIENLMRLAVLNHGRSVQELVTSGAPNQVMVRPISVTWASFVLKACCQNEQPWLGDEH